MNELIPNPVLYILVRTDMDSMNPGRVAAQVSHAANQFAYRMTREKDSNLNPEAFKLFTVWEKQARGFGTVIVLDGVSLSNIEEVVMNYELCSDLVIDPEYVIRDGEVVHFVPDVVTCGYVFVNKNKVENECKSTGPSLSYFTLYTGEKTDDESIAYGGLYSSR